MAALRAEKHEAVQTAASIPDSVRPAPETSKIKLDLLMDVEMAVTLRFGSRRLLLREVLDLIPGAVVDLDRQVEEPVDVLLDGRLVARGEVVVMDGNYGIRVTEVGSSSL
jgi:flagellar motor switch protein FliN